MVEAYRKDGSFPREMEEAAQQLAKVQVDRFRLFAEDLVWQFPEKTYQQHLCEQALARLHDDAIVPYIKHVIQVLCNKAVPLQDKE
jgi:hypothetical protein